MGANDILALNANFATWKAARAPDLMTLGNVNAWEYYCIDQFLKQFPVSDEDVLAGLVGGGNDGGADGVYFLVNRRPVEEDTELDPKASCRVNLLILQVKQNQGFSPTEINKLIFFSDDIMDLSRQPSAYTNTYNPKVLEAMRIFKKKFHEIAGAFPDIFIDYYYVTKSDEGPNGDAVAASKRVIAKAKEHLSSAKCTFNFIDAQKLWTQVQLRSPKSRTLHWHANPLETPEGWVGLVKLYQYWIFLLDEHGDLQERIFESNVRGFQQNTSVNDGIRKTLDKPGKADFWLLNNGITILTGKATTAGFQRLQIEDPQIVNGLQSSRQIDAYYRSLTNPDAVKNDGRRLLVRVIQSPDEDVSDDVIRATNSQNKMPSEALRATDRIHRQIETLFRQYDLYYDRRKGQYKDEGKPIAKIISVVELLQAMLTIVLRRPNDARARPRDYIKDDEKYEQVYGEDRFNLTVYLKAIILYRKVNRWIETSGLEYVHRRNIRFYITMYVAAAALRHPYIPPDKLLTVDVDKLTDDLIADCAGRVWKRYTEAAQKTKADSATAYDAIAKGPQLLKTLETDLRRRFTPRKRKAPATS